MYVWVCGKDRETEKGKQSCVHYRFTPKARIPAWAEPGQSWERTLNLHGWQQTNHLAITTACKGLKWQGGIQQLEVGLEPTCFHRKHGYLN